MMYKKAIKAFDELFSALEKPEPVAELCKKTKTKKKTVLSRISRIEGFGIPIIKTREGEDKRVMYYRLGCSIPEAWARIETADYQIKITRAPTMTKCLRPNKTPWFILTSQCACLYD